MAQYFIYQNELCRSVCHCVFGDHFLQKKINNQIWLLKKSMKFAPEFCYYVYNKVIDKAVATFLNHDNLETSSVYNVRKC